jgi:predicted metal-dependent phosphoesterase TrpH
MSFRIDLHIHSTASDGVLTPTHVVQLALAKGLQVISLTDHDTTEGIEEALHAAEGTGLTVIPGVEISTNVPGAHELHILGYCLDLKHPGLQRHLERLGASRETRARKTLARLAQAGYPLSWEHLIELSGGGVIGRPHIAQALVDAHHVDSIEDAFRQHLGRDAPAYVERFRLSPPEAIQMIQEAGGLAVLAHPSRVIEHIPGLVREGLAGLEAYYPTYPPAEQRFLVSLAHKHGLIATGGSDFHGKGITNADDLGIVDVPWSVVDQLATRAHHGPASKRATECLA